jgi:hypothetical protein
MSVLTTAPPAVPRPRTAPRGYPLLLAGLCLFLAVHVVLRLLITPSLEPDDCDLALFSQSFALGYSEQPPLYFWMVWAAVKLFGLGILTLTVVRLLVLGAVHVALYALARSVQRDRRLALLAAAAPLLIPAYSWNAIAYTTQTLLVIAATVATLHAALRLRRGRTADYLLFGVLLAAGTLSKYNYLLFAAALVPAALSVRRFRPCLLDRRVLLSAGVALALLAPHLAWLARHGGYVRDSLATKTGVAEGHTLARVGEGLANLAMNVGLGLALLGVACVAVFPGGFRRPAEDPLADRRRVLGWFVLATLGLLALMVVAGGTSRFQDRWLHPVLLVVPVWFFARLDGAALAPGRLKAFARVLAVAAVALTAGRAAQVRLGGLDRGRYPLQMDFGPAAEQLTEDGLGSADLFVTERELAGNLRLRLPGAWVVCAQHPAYAPPPRPDGPAYYVWNATDGPRPPSPSAGTPRRAPPSATRTFRRSCRADGTPASPTSASPRWRVIGRPRPSVNRKASSQSAHRVTTDRGGIARRGG